MEDEQDEDKLTGWVVCGRRIGQATGWDQGGTFDMQIYGLVPHPEYKGPRSEECVTFFFERGMVEAYDPEGNVTGSCDLIEAIKDCPVDRIE